jgi:formamidopyrimidine-DNA glycosylase
MPELPEVERAVQTLRPAMEGARFARVLVRRRRLRTMLPRRFESRLEGAAVKTLRRRGKYLVADLATNDLLVMHLGMSGSFEVHTGAAAPLTKHDHVIFQMSNGRTIVFNDPRRFGSMWLYDEGAALTSAIAALGPEPLDDSFAADVLAERLHGRTGPLKTVLSDQKVIAGLGNIYVSEALHRARLSPERRSGTLVTGDGRVTPALRALVRAIQNTLSDALAVPSGDDDRFRVYDREGHRCPRRGCPGTITRIVQAGRSTFYCPRCQR